MQAADENEDPLLPAAGETRPGGLARAQRLRTGFGCFFQLTAFPPLRSIPSRAARARNLSLGAPRRGAPSRLSIPLPRSLRAPSEKVAKQQETRRSEHPFASIHKH